MQHDLLVKYQKMEETTIQLDFKNSQIIDEVEDLTKAVFTKRKTKSFGEQKTVNEKNSIFYEFMEEAS